MADQLSPVIGQPSEAPTTPPKRRVLWKWSLLVTGILAVILLWRCGFGLLEGRRLSETGVQQFHALLNSGDYERIYDQAGDAFRNAGTRQDLIRFLQAVHTKLGIAGSYSLNNMNVTATPTGTYIVAVYSTTFTGGVATETFTWLRKGNGVVLNGYHIQSMKLITD